ncbi:hypothetical protein [Aquibacillus rhizosphaerae]|uniref:ABC transporter permease n=1 Tax=Aquibacillus rhizosphaerae TaxID=3051431 RepID=A0ABT7L888_9BACI|nr:hypothetical protein [Aquibacillus sp. LR5S19]MDL4842081.1 hypothetical protein [Aquibacillus sp. LR5S19]
MIQQAMWLARKEIKQQFVPFLFTMAVTSFFATATTLQLSMAVEYIFGEGSTDYKSLFLDLIFLLITPSFAAIFMSSPYLTFRTIKEDPFSKRMALFRALPISIKTLALSRIIIMLITFLSLSIIFYLIISIGLTQLSPTYLTPMEWMSFMVFWFGYALAIGGYNSFIEYGTNGRVLYIVPTIILLSFFLFWYFFRRITDRSVVELSLLMIKEYQWIPAITFLLIGIAGCTFWYYLLSNRLRRRDYL